MDKGVMNFIKNMLRKKVKDRVCNLEAAKKLPLFDKFEWNKLIDYKETPPYVPKTLSEEHSLSKTSVRFLDNLYSSTYHKRIENEELSEGSSQEGFDPEWIKNF